MGEKGNVLDALGDLPATALQEAPEVFMAYQAYLERRDRQAALPTEEKAEGAGPATETPPAETGGQATSA